MKIFKEQADIVKELSELPPFSEGDFNQKLLRASLLTAWATLQLTVQDGE